MVAKQIPLYQRSKYLTKLLLHGFGLNVFEKYFPLIVIEIKMKKPEEILVISRKTFRTIKKQDSHQRRVVY